MTPQEWSLIAADVQARWPNAEPWGPSTLSAFGQDLARFSAGDVRGAFMDYYREGHPFPPNGGQIEARLIDQGSAQDMGWEAGLMTLDRMGWEFGQYRAEEAAAAINAIGDPILPEMVRLLGWTHLVMHTDFASTSFRAQFRDSWQNLRQRVARTGRSYPALDGGPPVLRIATSEEFTTPDGDLIEALAIREEQA